MPRTPGEIAGDGSFGGVPARPGPSGGKARLRALEFERARGLGTGRESPPATTAQREIGQAWADALAADVPDDGHTPRWRPLGPTVVHGGQTYGGGRTDVAGRVSAVAVDPDDGRHLLVGAAGGGVWESRDRGASWVPRGDGLATLTVGALCFDPHGPGVAYLGSGEANSAYGHFGQGLYRSADGGTTWTLAAGRPFVGQGFFELVVDPVERDVLYAATGVDWVGALHVSRDGGEHWDTAREQLCWSVSAHPGGGAVEVLAAFVDGLYRHTDGGGGWSPVPLPDLPDGTAFMRMAVSHTRDDGDVAWVWAATYDRAAGQWPPPMTARLWRRSSREAPFVTVPELGGVDPKQASYDWYVRAVPDDPTTAYVGAIDLYRVVVASGDPVWTDVSSRYGSGDSIHPDQHAFAFDPADPDVLYAGSDGGLYRSPNRGMNWTPLDEGLAITEIEYLAQDPGTANWLLAGTQDNGTIRYVGRPDWDHVADGDGGDCGVGQDVVYHSNYHMGLEHSADRGTTWTPAALTLDAGYSSPFYPPLEACGPVVAQAGQSVLVSRDRALSFTEVLLPGRPTWATALAIPDPDHVYVGTDDGRVLRIVFSGGEWGRAIPLGAIGHSVSDLWVGPDGGLRIWATSSRGDAEAQVYRSDDGGRSWTGCTNGLPRLPANAVEVHPADPAQVWVGTDKGVYRSLDGGVSWSGMSAGLPNCIVADLLYQEQAGLLRAGTRSRGVWECVVGRAPGPSAGVEAWGSLDPEASGTWTAAGWPASWQVHWSVQPEAVGARLAWDVTVERTSAEHVTHRVDVRNIGDRATSFELRYAIVSRR